MAVRLKPKALKNEFSYKAQKKTRKGSADLGIESESNRIGRKFKVGAIIERYQRAEKGDSRFIKSMNLR